MGPFGLFYWRRCTKGPAHFWRSCQCLPWLFLVSYQWWFRSGKIKNFISWISCLIQKDLWNMSMILYFWSKMCIKICRFVIFLKLCSSLTFDTNVEEDFERTRTSICKVSCHDADDCNTYRFPGFGVTHNFLSFQSILHSFCRP